MPEVPTELYREILVRVPAEPLLRFRCVCKEWKAVIDDPDFRQLHVECQVGAEDMLMIRSADRKLYSLSLESLNHLEGSTKKIEAVLHIRKVLPKGVPTDCEFPMPSCHGLILIQKSIRYKGWVLWNPFLRDWLELPQNEEFGHTDFGGLGYDSSTNDYKVVRHSWAHDDLGKTFIYSVKLNQWHRIQDFPSCSYPAGNGAYFDGALHWLAYANDAGEGWHIRCIIALDLSTETYCKLPLLSASLEKSNIFCMGSKAARVYEYPNLFVVITFKFNFQQVLELHYSFISFLFNRGTPASNTRASGVSFQSDLTSKKSRGKNSFEFDPMFQVTMDRRCSCCVNPKCMGVFNWYF